MTEPATGRPVPHEAVPPARPQADWGGVVKRLDRLTLVAVLLGLFYPRPYGLVLGANVALPLVAIWVLRMAGDAIEFPQSRRNAPRPNLDAPLLFPSLILILRLLLDYDFVADRWSVGLGFGAVAVGWGLFHAFLPKQPGRTAWAFSLALGVLYAMPMLFLTDVW